MTSVDITFKNLQSHENTRFSLHPGINFILADGNNVGKSTIFKVLSCIARAPSNNPGKIAVLIRYGCSEAIATFKYLSEIVVAHFTKYGNESAKLYFEHSHADGTITRSPACPQSLLDALGIVISTDGDLINFNDANSVQLISEVSVEADSIITHIMRDITVEHVKSNIYSLGREVNMDSKLLHNKLETLTSSLEGKVYRPSVDEFFENYSLLDSASRVCDSIYIPEDSRQNLPPSTDIRMVRRILSALDDLSCKSLITKFENNSIDIRLVESAINILRGLDKVAESAKLVKCQNFDMNIAATGEVYQVASKAFKAMRYLEQVRDYASQLDKLRSERRAIEVQLFEKGQVVSCPVKGKVLYTDEKCIPYST